MYAALTVGSSNNISNKLSEIVLFMSAIYVPAYLSYAKKHLYRLLSVSCDKGF